MKDILYLVRVTYDDTQDCYIAKTTRNITLEGYGQTPGEALVDFGERLDHYHFEEEEDGEE